MTTIIIKYRILNKECEYILDDKTFDKHLLAICDVVKCVGLSTNYVLAMDVTNTIVQPMVSIRSKITILLTSSRFINAFLTYCKVVELYAQIKYHYNQ